MKLRVLVFGGLLILFGSWGFYAHKKVNELAVYLLHDELFAWYKPHIAYLVDHSVDPDKRRYVNPEEGIRHYMDAEAWWPLDSVPEHWREALKKFGEDSLQKHGVLPWHVNTMCYRLRWAFQNKDATQILKQTAELGHYVGDLHVPLHTTRNYNGQLTNQHGIHGLWETDIPELHFEQMIMQSDSLKYIPRIQAAIWQVYNESHALVTTVLSLDKALRREYDSTSIYAYRQRGKGLKSGYSSKYIRTYHLKLDGMVESRLVSSYHFLANLIFTCWVDAGQPDLDDMRVDRQQTAKDTGENHGFQIRKILGREEPSH